MEELFETLDTLPKDYVETAEKAKEKERRMKLRTEKLDIARKAQESRIQRALARSQAPTKKKVLIEISSKYSFHHRKENQLCFVQL